MYRIRREASKEIRKLKAGNFCSRFMKQGNMKNWKPPKNSKSRHCRLSADDASQVQSGQKIQ
jgi:hypothetical protein